LPALAPDERNALVDSLERLLAAEAPEKEVRRVMETPEGYDPALWKKLAELGLAGLVIGEEYGGAGASAEDVERVMEAAGAVLLCSPLLGSSVLSARLVEALGESDAAGRLLPDIAAGERIVAAALTGEAGTWTREAVAVRADGAALTGTASYVIHGQNAQSFIVLAWAGDELAAFEVDRAAAGLAITALPTFDHTLRLARLSFAATPARRIAATRPVWDAAREALDWALIALAGEQAGAGRHVLGFTIDYAKTRVQFGRPIGGFQALKHMAADLLVESESSISAARYAAQRFAAGADDAEEAVALAAFACADAFGQIAATAVQMHGGIAFTWTHPCHLYLRRARSGAQLFGASPAHRERYLTALGAAA
jgi:alkylation response protein AidB-like acyl-CoA dehydrogenase